MLAYRESIAIAKGHPPQAFSHAITAIASPTTPYGFLARCLVKGTRRTSALVNSVRGRNWRRPYSTRMGGGQNSNMDSTPKAPTPSGSAAPPLFTRLMNAWTSTPTKWYPLPLAVGALLLVVLQYRKKLSKSSKEVQVDEQGKEVIRLKGPWQVHVLGALPLRNLSRLWGYLNSLELPLWFRPYGFRLYSYIFSCDISEAEHSDDLSKYKSLGDFFERKLKPGLRPTDETAALVSPADGKVLHFGSVRDLRVEQVKGITYSLDALLGVETPGGSVASVEGNRRDMSIVDDREFANVNGIEYSLGQLLGDGSSSGVSTPISEDKDRQLGDHPNPVKYGEREDASLPPDTLAHDTSVALEMGSLSESLKGNKRGGVRVAGKKLKEGNELFFCVIYLAPGDYHRFHSPAAWVVERRRHFVGELFSVSPYMAKRLENLFVLNERVALLGRWKYGFFGMVPVGATNVGSIKINFDQTLRTNTRTRRRPPPGTYTEATYSSASPILNGQPLLKAQEMGGFSLGSTIVLVFEAPKGWEFDVRQGEKVRVGMRMGSVRESA